jgi:flavorubredoxin
MGKRAMDAHFHQTDWPVEVVKTGDSISLGENTVRFIETRMLHWPDSMVSYIPEKKLAICNDIFGQNIASSARFADEANRAVLEHAMREYYANIVNPYSAVTLKTLDALAGMNLDIDMIAPDHGLIFRGDDVAYAMNSYRAFAEQKPTAKAVIAYDTMWHSTEKMAEAIGQGLEDAGIDVQIMWTKANHHSRIQTELHNAGALIVGSPTHNNGILPGVAALLTYVKGLRPLNKVGAAFGSFGWSGESVKCISEHLESMGVELVEGVKCKHVPDHEALGQCYDLGQAVAAALKAKL